MSDLCNACGGNGTRRLPNGVEECRECDGLGWRRTDQSDLAAALARVAELEGQNARLREALKPLASEGLSNTVPMVCADDYQVVTRLRWVDLRRAAAVLASTPSAPEPEPGPRATGKRVGMEEASDLASVASTCAELLRVVYISFDAGGESARSLRSQCLEVALFAIRKLAGGVNIVERKRCEADEWLFMANARMTLGERATAIRAAISPSDAPADDGWCRDMSKAPKSDVPVLLACEYTNGCFVEVGKWTAEWWLTEDNRPVIPYAWRPLPPPALNEGEARR